ncbi:hypothetical protein B0H10DRAFT_2043871, partial [Mycena sp. CBHHK59/15]
MSPPPPARRPPLASWAMINRCPHTLRTTATSGSRPTRTRRAARRLSRRVRDTVRRGRATQGLQRRGGAPRGEDGRGVLSDARPDGADPVSAAPPPEGRSSAEVRDACAQERRVGVLL